jgi:1-acyl-sn-glycerol-3-phosphate acyltransferase
MIARAIEWLLIVSVRLLSRAKPCGPGFAQARGQCIYVANHTSHLDVVLLLSTLPPALRQCTRPVAAEEYWTAGPLRRLLIHSIFRGVLIERDRLQLNPLEPVASALREGDSLIFFPEGTRGPGGTLQPLKPGIFHLARWFPDVDIVPVWIGQSVIFGNSLPWKEGQQQDEFLARIREALEGLRP